MVSLLSSTGEETAQDAIDLLTTTATNLRSVVEGVLYAADRAMLKVPKSQLERFVPKGMFRQLDSNVLRLNFVELKFRG